MNHDRKDQALSSQRFADEIQFLNEAGFTEMLVLKLNRWLDRTGRLLDIQLNENAIAFYEVGDTPAEMVNFPLMGSLFHGDKNEDDLGPVKAQATSLPHIQRNPALIRSVSHLVDIAWLYGQVADQYPGMSASWNSFVSKHIEEAFQTAAAASRVVETDATTQMVLQTLHSVLINDVSDYEALEDYEADINALHQLLIQGRTDVLSRNLSGLFRRIFKHFPPEPPQEQSRQNQKPQPDGDNQRQSGSNPGENQPGDEWAESLSQLGEFLNQLNELMDESPSKQVEVELSTPEMPAGLDTELLEALEKMNADVWAPAQDIEPYLHFTVPSSSEQERLYRQIADVYSMEIDDARNIINETFRILPKMQRAQRFGRLDGPRIHRAMLGEQEVFRLDSLDTLGKMDAVLIIDESGSMGAGVGSLKSSQVVDAFNKNANRSSYDSITGESLVSASHNTRAALARDLAIILSEASHDLHGFNFTVAGYTHSHAEGKVLQQTVEAYNKLHGTENHHRFSWDIVRQFGNHENPYPIVHARGFSGNADLQALSWGIEKLSNSTADQRALIYLADGQTYQMDSENDAYAELIADAERQGIYIHWFDLSGDKNANDHSALKHLPRHAITNATDMIDSLHDLLHSIVHLSHR